MITIKSRGGIHTVTVNGKAFEFAELTTAWKFVFFANELLSQSCN